MLFPIAKATELAPRYSAYFGLEPGGGGLLETLRRLPADGLTRCKSLLEQVAASSGRVFVCGNGGSYDNSFLIAEQLAESLKLCAKTPGSEARYLDGEYADIFVAGLKRDGLRRGDLVIAVSGSGNSENVLRALRFAHERGAEILALGGRDGGKMRAIVGDERLLLVEADGVETLEDCHLAIGAVLARAIRLRVPPEDAVRSFCDTLEKSLRRGGNLLALGEIGSRMLGTMVTEGFTYVLGQGIGARHFRAEVSRGLTTAVPLRGVCAPELLSTSSYTAAANDDGKEFALLDGLAKFPRGPKHFALLIEIPEQPRCSELVREYLGAEDAAVEARENAATPFLTLGGRGRNVDLLPFIENGWNGDFLVSMIGHATSEVLRRYLASVFEVRRLEDERLLNALAGRKKLSLARTLELERVLRREGKLLEHEVVTFAHGAAYAARDPAQWGLPRGQ